MKRERMGRIDAAIQRALAVTISRDMKDPRLAFTTVTRVEITPDLERAKVYVSIIGDRHQAFRTMEALRRASSFLRGELGHAVDLRHTPELEFIEDRSTERAIALNATFNKIESRRAAATPDGETEAGEPVDDEPDAQGTTVAEGAVVATSDLDDATTSTETPAAPGPLEGAAHATATGGASA